MRVGYIKMGTGKNFLNYLDPVNLNSMLLYRKKYVFDNVNHKTNYMSNKTSIGNRLLHEL